MTRPDHLKSTPFAAAYPGGVVEWIDVLGCAVPLTWGDPVAEYNAVRRAAAAMEFSMLLKWDVEGNGAVATVNAVFSRDVGTLSPGRIAYGVVVNESGGMVDDCTVFVHSAEHIRVFGGNPEVGDYLDAHRSAGVRVTQRRDDVAQLSVQGPSSRRILQRLTDADLSGDALPYYRFLTGVTMAGLTAQVGRIGFTGELGYEIVLPARHAETFWHALFDVGAPAGLLPAGAAAVMMCRIESGMLMAELEYDHSMTPFECRMGWAVDFSKAHFHGRQALMAARENPVLTVVSVLLPAGAEYDGVALMSNGVEVGRISMAVTSPYLGGETLGLARVKREFSAVGAELDLAGVAGGAAKIVETPVYDPGRVRVRS